ncbi:MAG TPA: AI-2E family transporter, partial [Microbacterium sp.]|nr:AI-2E family transporter [Microbacterium sp.]
VFVALVYNGWVIALIMLGIVLLVQQVEGHILQPLIMGTAVKVHPLGVVVAVATGSLLAGIPGALFAVPVAAVLNVMIVFVSRGSWKGDPGPPATEVRSPLWTTVPQRPGFQRGE